MRLILRRIVVLSLAIAMMAISVAAAGLSPSTVVSGKTK
jgi:hypothetical protein